MMEGSVSEAPNKHGSTSNPVATRVRAVSVSNASSTSANKTSKRKSTSLPTETVEYLKAWMMSPEHIAHPYPTEQEKAKIMADTCIELKQLTNWFVNNRKRYWKPRVEARVQTQASFKTAPSNTSKNTANTETAPVDLFDPDLAIVATTTGSANQPEISAPSDVPLAKIVSVASFQALLEKASVSLSPISTHNSVFHHVESLLNGPSRLVSDASDSSSIGTEDETSSNTSTAGSVTTPQSEGIKTEQMSVHILRHTGQVPTVEDVTILTNVPAERILRTFDDCVLSYCVPASGNRKKSQSRRDAEIVRTKKHYLKVYMAEVAEASKARNEIRATAWTKRARSPAGNEATAEDPLSPRAKFRRVSVQLWQDACRSASHGYDHDALPTLEEASQLFGYSNSDCVDCVSN
jgi:hypothetical protein